MEANPDNSTWVHVDEHAGLNDRVAELSCHIAALNHSDASVRWMALATLGKIGDVAAIPSLIPPLINPDSSTR